MNLRFVLAPAMLLALSVQFPAIAQTSAEKQIGEACTSAQQCQDGSYCNGVEECHGVCMRAAQPCLAGQQCDDVQQRCVTPRTDADSDGHNSMATGGDDCDDLDPNNFPGHAEVWDAADHDDDCDPKTHGLPPDGLFGGMGRVGPVQVCSGGSVVVLTGTVGGHEDFREVKCEAGYGCRTQPSGDGACQPMGADYMAPPLLANIPRGDQVLPSHDAMQRTLANPSALRPLAPAAGSSIVAPRPTAPVAVPVVKPKLACATGQAYSAAAGKCIPIPPR